MKVGILTLPLRHNYGGILQAFALQTVLKRMGHDAYLVRFAPHRPTLLQTAFQHSKNICKRLLGRPTIRLLDQKLQDRVVFKNLNRFIEDRIHPKTGLIRNMAELRKMDKTEAFDAYVVGSDQVWRPDYARHLLPAYFCAFTNRTVIRIAYAASFGSSHWALSPEKISSFRDAIQRFDAVSVREESGVSLCKSKLNCDASLVLDPTMLLTREEYLDSLSLTERPQGTGGIFEYFLDRNAYKNDVSRQLQVKMGLSPFTLDVPQDSDRFDLEQLTLHPIEEWVYSFERAEHIVTDSFHGCVFSILFNKPFTVIGNVGRGIDRFHTLLQRFGLEHCLLQEGDTCEVTVHAVDENKVKLKMSEWRQRSLQILGEALNA